MSFQLSIDCTDPEVMVRFWALALGYEPEEPPEGFASWRSFWLSIGLPDDEAVDSGESIVDPTGRGPRIRFQVVPEGKTVKNRLHLDLDAGGSRRVPLPERRARVLARVDELVRAGASRVQVLEQDGLDHFGVVMRDPEGNEFCVR